MATKLYIYFAMALLFRVPSSISYAGEFSNIHESQHLLDAVNAKMKKMNLSPFTLDSFTVWLALQGESSHRYEGEIDSKIADLIESLKSNTNFKFEVEVIDYPSDRILLNDGDKTGPALSLPPYRVLELHILDHPRGSLMRSGQPLKITWISIVIAAVLEADVRASQ